MSADGGSEAGEDARSAGTRKSAKAFRTISEVSDVLDVPQHVLRFWETKFSQIRPMKRGGGRRYYRPEDIVLLRGVRELLYDDGYTIKGVQKLLREGGVKVDFVPEGLSAGGSKAAAAEAAAKKENLSPLPAGVPYELRLKKGGSVIMAGMTAEPEPEGEPERVVVQHVLISFVGKLPGKQIERTEEEARRLAYEVLDRAKRGVDVASAGAE